jgi:hypothetical protein
MRDARSRRVLRRRRARTRGHEPAAERAGEDLPRPGRDGAEGQGLRDAQQEREARIVAETAGTSTTEQLAAALERERQAAAHATELTALSVQLRADVDAERIRLEQAREAQATAEATVVTTAAQLVVAREAEAHASRTATELTTLADQLRAEVEAERQRAAAAETARAEAIDHRTAAETALSAIVQTVRDADASRDEAIIRAADADTAAAAARTLAEELERAAGELRQVVTSTTAERDTLAAAVTVADTAAVAARADADRLEVERLALRADVETATARALAADAALAEARARIVALEQDITTATAAAAADADARTRAHGELQTRLQALETELAEVTTARTTADRDLEESRRRVTELEQQVRAAGEQLAAVSAVMEQVRGAQDASVAPLQTAIGALERELTEARTQVTASDETARQAAVSVTRLQAELQTVRQADAGAMAALIAAHRGLIIDTMRRMVERETDRAKRAQTTAPKLRLWLDTFYEGHADLMRTALLPAIRVHLAFIRAIEDPADAVRRIVDAHVAESRRQILTVLDGDADALAPSLAGLLYRWEQDRVTALADQLMEKELSYARSL